MIIELSRSFAAFSPIEWNVYHQAVENLVVAHGHGWHMFAPSRPVANSIASGCQLSRTQHDVLEYYVRPKVATLLGQAKSADYTILAVEDNHSLIKERDNQIIVPLRRFSDISACMSARLLTENSDTDGAYIHTLCQILRRPLGYGSFINVELVHGGGSTTAGLLRNSWLDTRPLICVVDCDRPFPEAAIGSTARAVNTVGNTSPSGTVVVNILEVREIENLIPMSFLLEVYRGNLDTLSCISRLCSYLNHDNAATVPFKPLDYIDFKEGLRVKDVAKMPLDIKEHYKVLGNMAGQTAIYDYEYDELDNEKVIIPGISRNVVDSTLTFLRKNPRMEREFARKVMKAPFFLHLEPIVRKVLSFGTAGDRLPVR